MYHRFSLFYPSLRRTQTGVAAVEFALLISILLTIFFGIFVYWHALQAQQSVVRAAGDGARYVHELYFGSKFKNIDLEHEAKTVVEHSLIQSGLSLSHLESQDQENLVTLIQTPQDITLTVSYPLQLLPGDSSHALKGLLGTPQKLQAQSVLLLAHQ